MAFEKLFYPLGDMRYRVTKMFNIIKLYLMSKTLKWKKKIKLLFLIWDEEYYKSKSFISYQAKFLLWINIFKSTIFLSSIILYKIS